MSVVSNIRGKIGGTLVILALTFIFWGSSSLKSQDTMLVRADFEVFGRVQGVFFRKFTQGQAKQLGICGWIRNTPRQTVEGQIEGDKGQIEKMKDWLRHTGSPQSRISKAVFSNEKEVSEAQFSTFDIKR